MSIFLSDEQKVAALKRRAENKNLPQMGGGNYPSRTNSGFAGDQGGLGQLSTDSFGNIIPPKTIIGKAGQGILEGIDQFVLEPGALIGDLIQKPFSSLFSETKEYESYLRDKKEREDRAKEKRGQLIPDKFYPYEGITDFNFDTGLSPEDIEKLKAKKTTSDETLPGISDEQKLRYLEDEQTGMENVEGAGTEDKTDKEKNPYENLLIAGIESYKDALGDPEKPKSIEEYKKEFAKATGIDVSGKPDKSTALMALGLALMQNKAGKGFNVGKMLTAVGKAGEKALPAFEKAKTEAKAGKLAAGKYALTERAKATNVLTNRKQDIANKIFEISKLEYSFDKSMQLQKLKGIQALNKLALENEAALVEAEMTALKENGELGKLTTISIPGTTSQDDFKIQGQQLGKTGTFYVQGAQGNLRALNLKLKGAQGGLNTVRIMKEAAAGGETTGYKGIYNNLSGMFKGALSQEINPESDISKGMEPTEAYRRATGKLLIEFRKLLTGGEAGNAISDKDVKIIEENLGKTDFISFKSTAEILGAIEGIESIFQKRADMFAAQKETFIDYVTNSGQIGGLQIEDYGKKGDYEDDYIAYIPELVGDELVYKLPKS